MIARRAALATLALTSLLWLPGAGCDLFATREPVLSTGAGSQWLRPTSPGVIVTNLLVAFENSIFNDYQRALTEDFAFVPDEADRFDLDTTERPGENVYEGWDRDVESVTAENIALGVDSLTVDVELFSESSDADGRRLQKYTYELLLWRGDEATPYVGEAWFLIRQESNGEWYIQEWEDVRGSGERSWGFLKGISRP